MSVDAAQAMDQMYRFQRHIYDVTRKYYLLGRDRLLHELQPPKGGAILEIGCGTGRNLIQAARLYPEAELYGIDVSDEMLVSARAAIAKAGLAARIHVAQADATGFDPHALFGRAVFDRVFVSYVVSMIPPWQAALAHALTHLAADGTLHVVDFGGAPAWPRWFQRGLALWLSWFDVTPRATLTPVLAACASQCQRSAQTMGLYGGYAVLGIVGPVQP